MKIDNIILPATVTDGEAIKIATKRCGMPIADVKHFRILKKSVDARNKNDIKYVYNIEVSRSPIDDNIYFELPASDTNKKILIAGFGPAGMFCALFLARAGYKPIVVERGKNVDDRKIECESK